MFNGFSRAGFKTKGAATALNGTNYVFVEIDEFSRSMQVDSVELLFDTLGGTGYVATIYLSRDSAGLYPLTSDTVSGATQTLTDTPGSRGGASFTVGKDVHYLDTTYSTAGTKTDSGGTDTYDRGDPSQKMTIAVKLSTSGTGNITDVIVNFRAGSS